MICLGCLELVSEKATNLCCTLILPPESPVHISSKQVDLPKLLVCPTVCITLGLMLLKIRVRRLQEANIGVKVISSDIYINVNSDIYIVLV